MPLNPKAKLVENILDLKSLEQKPTRDGFGLGMLQAGDENPNVVGLDMNGPIIDSMIAC